MRFPVPAGLWRGGMHRLAKEKSPVDIYGNCFTSGLRVGGRTPDVTTRPPSSTT